ncbi:hypothetical protein Dsin_029959, partial [Dipteronia sinensis]
NLQNLRNYLYFPGGLSIQFKESKPTELQVKWMIHNEIITNASYCIGLGEEKLWLMLKLIALIQQHQFIT